MESMMKLARQSGKIKFFRAEDGYGFITVDDGVDIFFHVTKFASDTDLEKIVREARVSFVIIKGPKGYSAVHIKLEDEENAEIYSTESKEEVK